MDGNYLSNYLEWLNVFLDGNKEFISDDLDFFICNISKMEWTITGLGMLSLTESLLYGSSGVSCELLVNLRSTKKPGRRPDQLSLQLFNNVVQPPTLILERNSFYYSELRKSGYTVESYDSGALGLPSKWRSFYFEKCEGEAEGVSYERFLEILP